MTRHDPTSPRAVVWLDEDYDRAYASDGVSRFGAYLRQSAHRFLSWDEEPTTDAAMFAATAFEVGCAPVMAPPYVATHPRVVGLAAHCDDDDRRAVRVELAVDVPREFATVLPRGWRGWQHSDDGHRWYEPGDNDRPAAVLTLTVRVPFPAVDLLPGTAYDDHGNPHVPTAKDAVRALAAHVNAHLAGVLDTLATGWWSR